MAVENERGCSMNTIFSERLKKAMDLCGYRQADVLEKAAFNCKETGTKLASGDLSQYLSGKQVPSEDVQRTIATALGLASDYFAKPDKAVTALPKTELRNKVIERLDVLEAAKIMQMNHNTVREGLKQGVKVQLYQWTSKLKGNEVILKVLEKKWNGGFSEPSHAQRIKSGGSVELKINFNWINYNIEESSEMCAYLLEQGFEKVKDTVFTKKIENIC